VNPVDFARDWADAWNRRAIEEVLAHFDDRIEFTSPTALAVTGVCTVRGKPALREYWVSAMSSIQSIRFTVDRVLWAEERRELAVIYTAEINGLIFDPLGRIVRAEIFHGAPAITSA
jgi:hypothetical protein